MPEREKGESLLTLPWECEYSLVVRQLEHPLKRDIEIDRKIDIDRYRQQIDRQTDRLTERLTDKDRQKHSERVRKETRRDKHTHREGGNILERKGD